MINLPKDYIDEIKNIIGEDKLNEYLSSLELAINSGVVINDKKINDTLLKEVLNEYEYNEKYNNKYYTYKKNDEINIGKSIYHHMGLIYSQEPSSYEVINNLKINKDFNFIDLCASPGGKSIDTLLKQNNGICILNEIDSARCKILKSNIERMGFLNTIITNNNPNDFLDIYDGFFDLVIVDAPCSGEGMFKKSEIAIKNWSKNYVNYISGVQKEIIDVAVKLVNESGYLVYSTCTFSKKEDEDNVLYILNNYKDFSVVKNDKLFPHTSDGEGQFYCIFKKNTCDTQNHNKVDILYDVDTSIPNIISKYFKDLNYFKGEFIIEKNKEINYIYYLSHELIKELNKIKTLKVKYKGLLIGEYDKNGFIPSNELAHSNIINSYKYLVDIDKTSAYKYLNGEVINVNDDIKLLNKEFDFDKKEYVILTYKNVGIGVGKLVDKKIKNLYPKGLRNL